MNLLCDELRRKRCAAKDFSVECAAFVIAGLGDVEFRRKYPAEIAASDMISTIASSTNASLRNFMNVLSFVRSKTSRRSAPEDRIKRIAIQIHQPQQDEIDQRVLKV